MRKLEAGRLGRETDLFLVSVEDTSVLDIALKCLGQLLPKRGILGFKRSDLIRGLSIDEVQVLGSTFHGLKAQSPLLLHLLALLLDPDNLLVQFVILA